MGLELLNVSVSKPVMRLTDTVTIRFAVLNNTGARVRNLSAAVYVMESAFGVASSYGSHVWLEIEKSVSIANGASLTLEYLFQPSAGMRKYFAKYPDVCIVPAQLSVSTNYSDGTMESVRQDVVQLYDGRYAIGIERFALKRVTDGVANDEGTALQADMKIVLDEDVHLENARLTLHYAQGGDVDEDSPAIDLTAMIPQAIEGAVGVSVPGTFANGSDWAFLLVLHNGYEAVTAYVTVARAFANVHLSGMATGGVAFGKFSGSTPGRPLFESMYPALLLGGVEGVTNYAYGECRTGGRWIDGRPVYRHVLSIGQVETGKTVQLDFGVAAGDLGAVVSLRGMVQNSDGSLWFPLPSVHMSGEGYFRELAIMNANRADAAPAVRIRTGSGSGIAAGFVIVEFTRKSDPVRADGNSAAILGTALLGLMILGQEG